MKKPALEIDNLSIRVAGKLLFSGLGLQLNSGQKMTLIGRSGCGKTTLLRCLLGFVPPAEGRILVCGQTLDEQNVWQLRTRMAYVSQEPELPAARVSDLLERPFSFKSNGHLQGNLKQIPALLDALLLPVSLLDRDVSGLSGGEKQRVALLAALLLERQILLLDEASSALDDVARDAVIQLLLSRTELAVLSVSHDREWNDMSSELIDLSAYTALGSV